MRGWLFLLMSLALVGCTVVHSDPPGSGRPGTARVSPTPSAAALLPDRARSGLVRVEGAVPASPRPREATPHASGLARPTSHGHSNAVRRPRRQAGGTGFDASTLCGRGAAYGQIPSGLLDLCDHAMGG